ncbi:hypothetical protein GOV05_04770 [Candidatus Woesearchaeota archaeon]|nr:hypothetical protein [Candidatus Woesearchaeota archaeon]
MVNQRDTLKRLNEDREEEDKLVSDIYGYLQDSLNYITDMTSKEKEIVHEYLDTLISDSMRHSSMFSMLIQDVMNHGEDNY